MLGAGLGANVAAKSMSFSPDVSALALISPTTNNRDVLSIPAMRLYKGDVLIAAGAADKKAFGSQRYPQRGLFKRGGGESDFPDRV